MGADGHWYLVRFSDFAEKFPDLNAQDVGLWRVIVLGVEALSAYQDTNGRNDMEYGKGISELAELRHLQYRLEHGKRERDDFKSPFRPLTEKERAEAEARIAALEGSPDRQLWARLQEARDWFTKNAEDHCVWT
jgi:hypothetical protein